MVYNIVLGGEERKAGRECCVARLRSDGEMRGGFWVAGCCYVLFIYTQ